MKKSYIAPNTKATQIQPSCIITTSAKGSYDSSSISKESEENMSVRESIFDY